jgi:hypothetical protein
MWTEGYWEPPVNDFIISQNPSCIIETCQLFLQAPPREGIVTVPLQTTLISSIEGPFCLSSKAIGSRVIINSGASVCISPHRWDFVTYRDSKMKIKDLSSLNQVAGGGILSWFMKDTNGDSVKIELQGYHIPNAEVCLLSPQVLPRTVGGHAMQTVCDINFVLDNGNSFCAQ